MLRLAAIAALVLLGGCGAASPRQATLTTPSARAAGGHHDERPVAAPPREPASTAPPPAWVATQDGSRWLAFGSYCWSAHGRGACADMVGPELRHDVPTLIVRPGDPVRFHLAFTARSIDVYVGHGSRSVAGRRHARVLAWRAPRTRGSLVVMLDVRASAAGGSASYFARVSVR
jgi:hypothetical protein